MQINMDLVTAARYMQQQNGIRWAVPVWLTTVKDTPPVEVAPLARPIYTFWLMCGGDREMWLRTGITRVTLWRIVSGRVNPGLGEVVRLLCAAKDLGKVGAQHAAVFAWAVGLAVGREANPAQAISALAWQYAAWRTAIVMAEATVNGELVGVRGDVWGVDEVIADGRFVVDAVRRAVRLAGGGQWAVDVDFPPVWGATVLRAARGMLAGYVATLRKMPRVELGAGDAPINAEQVGRLWLQMAGGAAVGMVGNSVVETAAMVEEAKRAAAGVDPITGRRGRGRPPGAKNRRVAGGGVDAPVDLGE